MITLSEGVLLAFAGAVAVVVWWGVKELVGNSKLNALAIAGINTSLATINGRLNMAEALNDQHREEDRDKFRTNESDHAEMWHAINKKT